MRDSSGRGKLGRMLPSARTGTVLVAVLSVACAVAAVLLALTVVRPVPPHVQEPEVQIGRSVAPAPTSTPTPTTPSTVLLPPPPPVEDDDEDD